jgi:hypothetical protein
MAAVTWKNIAPQNTSGILNSMNTSAAALATAGKGIGDAVSGYVDDRQTRETDAFVTDLMAAGSQEERDAMISAANNSFLNLDQINKSNYELGAPDREMTAFTDQLQLEEDSAMRLDANRIANEFILKDRIAKEITAPAAALKAEAAEDLAWAKNNKPVDDPLTSGYFAELYGKDGKLDDSFLGWTGGGFDQADQVELSKYRSDFLAIYNTGKYKDDNRNVTMDDFNRFIVNGGMTFRDDAIKDEFLFNYEGTEHEIDNPDSMDKLYNAILESKNKTSNQDIVDSQAWAAFKTNNKDSFGANFWNNPDNLEEALRVFKKSGGTSKAYTAAEISGFRKTLSSEIAKTLQTENEELSGGPVEASEFLQNQAKKLIKEADFTDVTAREFIEELMNAKKEGLGIAPYQDEMLKQLLKKYAK